MSQEKCVSESPDTPENEAMALGDVVRLKGQSDSPNMTVTGIALNNVSQIAVKWWSYDRGCFMREEFHFNCLEKVKNL